MHRDPSLNKSIGPSDAWYRRVSPYSAGAGNVDPEGLYCLSLWPSPVRTAESQRESVLPTDSWIFIGTNYYGIIIILQIKRNVKNYIFMPKDQT
jgi:hypothetical protein